jgi:hypothetical protein
MVVYCFVYPVVVVLGLLLFYYGCIVTIIVVCVLIAVYVRIAVVL